MKRKLVAFLLAATMIVGTGLTANAAPNVDSMAAAGAGQEVTGEGTLQLPTIKITVPTSADFVINPFKMGVEKDGKTYSDQIICVPGEISSESDVAVAVNIAELTATEVQDGVTIATSEITDKTTTKSAFVYVEVVDGAADFAGKYSKTSKNQVVVPDASADNSKVKKASKDAVVTLAKGDAEATKAKFTIGGAVVANPTKVNDDKTVSAAPWTDADTFKVSFKFTFTPQVEATTTTP